MKGTSMATSNNELDEEMANDAKSVQANPDQLAKIIAASADLREQIRRIAFLEGKMEEAVKEKRRLEFEVLPGLMDGAGVLDLGLDTEERLVRENDIHASIPEKGMDKAVAWLDKNNLGSLVKAQFVVPIDKGDTKTRDRIATLLKKAKVEFALNSSIHAQTLKAFVRESVANGRKLPASFSVHIQPVVHIRAPKKSNRSK